MLVVLEIQYCRFSTNDQDMNTIFKSYFINSHQRSQPPPGPYCRWRPSRCHSGAGQVLIYVSLSHLRHVLQQVRKQNPFTPSSQNDGKVTTTFGGAGELDHTVKAS